MSQVYSSTAHLLSQFPMSRGTNLSQIEESFVAVHENRNKGREKENVECGYNSTDGGSRVLGSGLTTVSKATMNEGMSDFVVVVYSNAFAAIFVLLPSSPHLLQVNSSSLSMLLIQHRSTFELQSSFTMQQKKSPSTHTVHHL